MTMLSDFETRMETTRFQHELLEQQDLNIKFIAEEILQQLKARTKPLVIVYGGTMGSGKTTLTKLLSNELENTLIIRSNDTRAAAGHMFDRNQLNLKEGTIVLSFEVNNGKEFILNSIDNNPGLEYLFLSEGQFLGTEDDLQEVVDYALSRNVTVIYDCLSVFYNGRKVPNTKFLKRIADYSYEMWACDRFAAQKATMPMRVVRIAQDGSLPDEKDRNSAKYYLSMDDARRREIFEQISKSPFAQHLIKVEGENLVCLVPSHPELDDIYVSGQDERYYSTTVEMCCSILRSAGLSDVAEIYEKIDAEEKAKETLEP